MMSDPRSVFRFMAVCAAWDIACCTVGVFAGIGAWRLVRRVL